MYSKKAWTPAKFLQVGATLEVSQHGGKAPVKGKKHPT